MRLALAQVAHGLFSGEDQRLRAAVVRRLLGVAELGYRGVVAGRNRMYERGVLRSHRVGVPVISVGNITVGGTGKTPVVRWLAERMREVGYRPAVLLRGYRRDRRGLSDEAEMLKAALNADGRPAVVVHAEADRVAGAQRVRREHPEVDLFILDDGFQHRRLARAFDLVLVDAANPWGYGHVLPRGLLREPLSGLKRAGAFLLMHADQVSDERREEIQLLLRSYNAAAPTYRTRHAHVGLKAADGATMGMDELGRRRFFAVAGIAQPDRLDRQLAQFGAGYCGHRWFEDHHDYGEEDLAAVRREAGGAGADVIVVTEKDWAKLARLRCAGVGMPIWRIEMQVVFEGRQGAGLIELIRTVIEKTGADERQSR